jgi:hypothetical protein
MKEIDSKIIGFIIALTMAVLNAFLGNLEFTIVNSALMISAAIFVTKEDK